MKFTNTQSIFIQIADWICEQHLQGIYEEEGRIPSVRELAVQLEVNPNTVMRAYERLQSMDIIYNKRGIGYFFAPDALVLIRQLRHRQFLEEILPPVFKEMRLLGIDPAELTHEYTTYLLNEKTE